MELISLKKIDSHIYLATNPTTNAIKLVITLYRYCLAIK